MTTLSIAVVREKKTNHLIEWLFSIFGYGLILIVMTVLFKKTIKIDSSYLGLWAFIAAFIISILNLTIKPIIVKLTIPITALTLGIFYPFINVFILFIVDWLLGSHFEIQGVIMAFVVAILISFMKMATQKLVIEPIIEKE